MAELFLWPIPLDLLERDPPNALQLELDVIPCKVHTEAAVPDPIDFYSQRPVGLFFRGARFVTGR